MTQILNRRTVSNAPLGTLANNATIDLDTKYTTLLHKAFLFEYRARGFITSVDSGEFLTDDSCSIVLTQAAVPNLDIDSILEGAQITDQNMNIEVPSRQRIFALADITWLAFDPFATLAGTFGFDLVFKPRSKGGIPFTEGSGWTLSFINRTGSALTTGSQVHTMGIHERFAYEGGGGA